MNESVLGQRDGSKPGRPCRDTEAEAKFAIKYAYWAVEEAEYRVLDAALARMDADIMAADGS